MTHRPEFLPFLLTVLALVAIVVLTLAHDPVPDALYGLLAGGGAGALAVTQPLRTRRAGGQL